MQVKRNQVIVIRAAERGHNEPRLAKVKSVARDGTITCTWYMYRNSNVATDSVIASHEVVCIAHDVTAAQFRSLACSFGNQDAADPFVIKQAALDADYPQYAAMRKAYGLHDSISQGVARVRAAA